MQLGQQLFRQGHYVKAARALRNARPRIEPAPSTCHDATLDATHVTTKPEAQVMKLEEAHTDRVICDGQLSDALRMEGDAWRVAGQRWRAYEAHKAALTAAEEVGDLTRYSLCCAALALSTLAMHGARPLQSRRLGGAGGEAMGGLTRPHPP